jgi:hypothetical protein
LANKLKFPAYRVLCGSKCVDMAPLPRLAAVLLLVIITSAGSSASGQSVSVTDKTLWLAQNQSTSQVSGPTILPEAPGTVNGGNPFQGLGRPDDTGPQRANPIQQYVPGNNTTGLFSTGSNSSSPSAEQPGFGGQTGFASPAPNQNLNPLPQSASGSEPARDTTSDTRENATAEGEFSASKMLSNEDQNQSKTNQAGKTREANQLAMALKEMNGGNYKKCLETLDSIIKVEPKNAQAYYVKAVTNVLMRDFAHARQNYEMTLRYTSDEKLIAKTKAGLLKLGR